jgi:hypothetical protein
MSVEVGVFNRVMLSPTKSNSPPMPIVVVDTKRYHVWVWFAQERGVSEAVKGNPTTQVILRAEALKSA